jgi:hypothetical protein
LFAQALAQKSATDEINFILVQIYSHSVKIIFCFEFKKAENGSSGKNREKCIAMSLQPFDHLFKLLFRE